MVAKRLRVLVVDDYGGWRSVICSTLAQHPQLCIAGEAADGSEAIRKIAELLPDLIVLDIGLPKLNGLDVAVRVPELSPHSKVVIVSEMRSADIAEEAFRRGVLAYVIKSDAANELLPAVEAVLQGKPFISAYLSDRVFKTPGRMAPPSSHRHENVITPLPSRNSENRARHEVEFYAEDEAYVAGVTRYIEAVLRRGDPVILFATDSHRGRILHRLKAAGVDVDNLIGAGTMVLLDTFEALSAVMVDDKPDAVRCEQAVAALIGRAARNSTATHQHVSFCGQCAPLLLRQGNTDGAIQLEHLWDEITSTYGADTLCGYIWSEIPIENREEIVQKICAEHSGVFGLGSVH